MQGRRPAVPVGPSDCDVKLCGSRGHALETADQQMLPAALHPLVYLSLPLTKPLRVRRHTCQLEWLLLCQLHALFSSILSQDL